ncbi:ABC transporter ATP-binding protein [Chelatococcus asaccharovorans]|uniref:ABC transporter ATP-binding protein n=1 Tax=Chelatococcus asaccharovorans TaxID=28210 RepID=UPI00224C7605|nr:ABC transporter ATP-binding protein [Chelatococcus asaccharovorans]CAH1659284.1 High-affinity branched-chain amino acid transport ATP-binding protein LivF [Chelatococcus asaccharovorans]CAH1688046.1 High-affinity branched-chain amino acid transport ATP-binding protein LivF [Chelatococcus asaccharovorans]
MSEQTSKPILAIRDLKAGYGGGRMIVNGVDINVGAGEIVCVIGQNGAGKSTLLKGIVNLIQLRQGTVQLDGKDVTDLPAQKLLLEGLAYIPQGRSIFPRLTVAENIRMGGYLIKDRAVLKRRHEEMEAMFPALAELRGLQASSLSGGQQRQLELARTLMMDPKILMLDEPSIGLAPRIVDQVFTVLRDLAKLGKSVLMVEQNVRKALAAADRGYVLELGKVRLEDRAQALLDDERVAQLYMGMRPTAA